MKAGVGGSYTLTQFAKAAETTDRGDRVRGSSELKFWGLSILDKYGQASYWQGFELMVKGTRQINVRGQVRYTI